MEGLSTIFSLLAGEGKGLSTAPTWVKIVTLACMLGITICCSLYAYSQLSIN